MGACRPRPSRDASLASGERERGRTGAGVGVTLEPGRDADVSRVARDDHRTPLVASDPERLAIQCEPLGIRAARADHLAHHLRLEPDDAAVVLGDFVDSWSG